MAYSDWYRTRGLACVLVALAIAATFGCATDDPPQLGVEDETDAATDAAHGDDVRPENDADSGSDASETPDQSMPDADDFDMGAGCEVIECGPDGQCVSGTDGPQCVCDTDAVLVDGACHAGCPEHPNCRYWTLDDGAWSSRRVDDLPADITAAFDIETTDVAYLLTQTELFTFDIVTGEVQSMGGLEPLTGALTFDVVLGAFSVPAAHLGRPDGEESYQVTGLIGGVPNFASGNYDAGTFTPGLQDEFDIADFDETSLSAQWLDVENTQRWVPTSVDCPDATRPVGFLLTPSRVYYTEASGGACSGVSSSEAFDSSPMFGLDPAPAADKIEAAFYHDGKLSVFTAP